LGEFSTNGQFFENSEIALIFGPFFLTVKVMHFNFDKICVGLTFGDFFTSSSGHPGPEAGS
jgi:hypothetical protein